MTASIIAILAALVPFVIWLWKRKAARNDDPAFQSKQRHEAIAKEIFDRSPARINDSLAGDLDRLHSLQSDKQRPGSSPPDGR